MAEATIAFRERDRFERFVKLMRLDASIAFSRKTTDEVYTLRGVVLDTLLADISALERKERDPSGREALRSMAARYREERRTLPPDCTTDADLAAMRLRVRPPSTNW